LLFHFLLATAKCLFRSALEPPYHLHHLALLPHVQGLPIHLLAPPELVEDLRIELADFDVPRYGVDHQRLASADQRATPAYGPRVENKRLPYTLNVEPGEFGRDP